MLQNLWIVVGCLGCIYLHHTAEICRQPTINTTTGKIEVVVATRPNTLEPVPKPIQPASSIIDVPGASEMVGHSIGQPEAQPWAHWLRMGIPQLCTTSTIDYRLSTALLRTCGTKYALGFPIPAKPALPKLLAGLTGRDLRRSTGGHASRSHQKLVSMLPFLRCSVP
ncbi:hypothetical protein F4777DRAFT_447340 [Nemania sp. FL0916]|nr:hypothetical protein F4777DRAFT_447340 [Nemania sp. FL0916]